MTNEWNLRHFIKWLRTQPADRRYDYTDPNSCLIAEYRRAHGFKPESLKSNDIQHPFMKIVHPLGGMESRDWTYGEALNRARAAQKSLSAGQGGEK